MSDTRCANPAYQLEVDIIILEYLLYRTIEAHFSRFKWADGQEGQDDGVEQTSTSLLHIFNTIILLFKANHPTVAFSEVTTFNLKLLEFIILFTNRGSPSAPSSPLSNGTISELYQGHRANLHRRCRWILLRQAIRSETETKVEDSIASLWNFPNPLESDESTQPPNSTPTVTSDASLISLNSLLPRFLDLSAEAAGIVGEINEKWMHLAGGFMFQAALQSLRHAISSSPSHQTSLPILSTTTANEFRAAFAWGWVPPSTMAGNSYADAGHPSIQRTKEEDPDAEVESLIAAMFRDSDSDPPAAGDGEARSVIAERPEWTQTRLEYLSRFIIKPLPPPSPHQHAPTRLEILIAQLQSLTSRFHISTFETRILDFVAGLWTLSQGCENGVPLLLQVERGAIDGVTDKEFQELMRDISGDLVRSVSWGG